MVEREEYRRGLLMIGLAVCVLMGMLVPVGAATISVNWEADQDPGDGSEWEDTTGVSDFDWQTGTAVPRIAVNSGTTIGSAFEWDGTDSSQVALENADSFQDLPSGNPTGASAAFETWFKPRDLVGREVLWESGGSGDGTSITLDDATVRFVVKDRNVTPSIIEATLDQGDIGDFVQVIGSIDLGSDTVELFVNGATAAVDTSFTGNDWTGGNGLGLGSITSSTGPGGNTSNDIGGAGAFNFTGYEEFDGQIAIFRFYEESIDSAEAHRAYRNVLPEPSSPALLLLALCSLICLHRKTGG